MHSSHDLRLVVLSVVIATLAAHVALAFAGRTAAARGRARHVWLGAGALAMGVGIWSMHFVAMLAFQLHGPHGRLALAFDLPLVGLSILVAVAAAALAFTVAARPVVGTPALLCAGLLLGGAIAGVHYIGMAATRTAARYSYDPALVALSVVVAVGASIAAIWLFRRLGDPRSRGERLARHGAALVMGCAVAGMHFTGMAAVRYTPGPLPGTGHVLLASDSLAVVVALGALVLLGMAAAGIAAERMHRAVLRESAREGETRLRLALSAADLIVWEWDVATGSLLIHSAGGERGTDAAPTESRVVDVSDFMEQVHEDDRAHVLAAVDRATAERADLEVEYRMRRRDGRWCWRYSRGHVVSDGDGAPLRVVGVGMDITRRKELEEQLSHQAFHDPLTGLANRVLFRDRVEHAVARAGRGEPPAVLFLDLDNFKTVNDSFGHAAGDRLLVEVAGRITACLRVADTCARLGGDEFAVLLEDCGDAAGAGQHAAHVAERLLDALQAPLSLAGTTVVPGVSIGIATAAAGEGADVLLRNADLAMYRAKGAGRGRFVAFEPGMHAAVRRRLELESELRVAVAEAAAAHLAGEAPGQLVLHYQPIVALDAGYLAGFEALVRWRHPRHGMVSPAELIPIAEESGLIVPLGDWVLREACRQLAAWERDRTHGTLPLRMSVNISGRQLAQPAFPGEVAAALAAAALPARLLVLEVTESMLVDDSPATLERLRALKALGVELAIDDFGTGYSSLGYLERFPVDVLKIDKAFVDRVGGIDEESPLARAILGLGSALGMRVVAEGIETDAQWTRLRAMGCEYGQGYLFARPMPAADAEALLAGGGYVGGRRSAAELVGAG